MSKLIHLKCSPIITCIDIYSCLHLPCSAFPALKAAFLANKKGFRYASRKGRGLALEPRFDWKADYSRFLVKPK